MGGGIKLSVTFSDKHANLFKSHNGHKSFNSLQETRERQDTNDTNDHSSSSGGDESPSDNEIAPPTNDSDSSWTNPRE